MQFIRAIPNVMGCKFDGVYNEKGILHFESQETLSEIAHKLNYLLDTCCDYGQADPDSPWYRDHPILDDFENSLGFVSLRTSLEIQTRIMEIKGILTPENNPTVNFAIADELFQTFLNGNGQVIVNNHLYDYSFPNQILQVNIKNRPKDSLLKDWYRNHAIVHNAFDEDDYSNPEPSISNYSKIGNVVKTCTFGNIRVELTITDDGNSKKIFSTKVYDLNTSPATDISNIVTDTLLNISVGGVGGLTGSASSSRNQSIPLQFFMSGDYTICVEITGIDAWGRQYNFPCSCYVQFNIDVKEFCCKSYGNDFNSEIYDQSRNKKINGKLQVYNALIYSSVVGITTHYKRKNSSSNWKRAKASISVSIKGNLYNFVGCGFHEDFNPPEKSDKRRSLSKRKIFFYKKVSAKDQTSRTSSGHYVDGKYGFGLAIPKCDVVKVYALS
jgi:hypothetical protein